MDKLELDPRNLHVKMLSSLPSISQLLRQKRQRQIRDGRRIRAERMDVLGLLHGPESRGEGLALNPAAREQSRLILI